MHSLRCVGCTSVCGFGCLNNQWLLSLVERKVLAHVGVRVGPGVCGVVGVLTPVCDG